MALLHLPDSPPPAPVPAFAPVDAPTPPGFDSRDLMRGRREILIRHAGQTYRLRHTRNDKLILVK
jgi:hemin uptake protein HemP